MESGQLTVLPKFLAVVIAAAFLFFLWQLYAPQSFSDAKKVTYEIKKGSGYKEIAKDLQEQGVIKQRWPFEAYVLITASYGKLQAGTYQISPSQSVASIAKKFTTGDVVKNTVTIIEGWDLDDIGVALESKKVYSKKDFLAASTKDFSAEFDFLVDKPKDATLEGYVFPDTYQIPEDGLPDTFLKIALTNFGKKLTPELRQEITRQKKSIFEIVTMASIIEKEVQTPEDKKMVSGILWKRLEAGMALQVDATINYITGKGKSRASIDDTKIDSPYNTYLYPGLPKGPISNPGLDSITAAMYPTKSDYWYYLSADGTGKTIFSKTLEEHNAAIAKHLK